ncbi:MAG: Flp pilus assembly protein CpaB [Erythrobacter sp.]|uniref:Flp pilus assembly protein CpaB n=1 Tax=Erythrobacter sp. TaxID=1042 RepID=UPI0026101F0C|nr:Flp pilus assembly protein CpaB [Erythrobacter sp.]MDJ0979858.1 Flp pilus assembly protein CpaB [Erythrobacter sp.]
MDRKKLVLLLGALIVAVGTAFAARSMFLGGTTPSAEAAPAQPTGPKVLVANRALPAGTIIQADALDFQQWPEELVQDAYYIEGNAQLDSLLGTVVRFPITAGEPVTMGSLVSPGDRGFLAAALGPGMRAVTVPVSARTGVAGFVFPGDRVDLVLTQTVEGDGRPLRTAETVLRNLRVLATDQQTEKVQDPESGKTVVRAFRTVTIEVTPKLAEKVSVAQTIGTLSLVLRSIADNQAELERAIASGEIDIPEDATPEEEERILRTAMGMPVDKGTTFQTGGDVSRFQRKTLPEEEAAARRRREEAARAAQLAQERALAAARAAGRNLSGNQSGPVVRVIRGTQATEVPAGNVRGAANGLLNSQSRGLREAGETVPAATTATLIK